VCARDIQLGPTFCRASLASSMHISVKDMSSVLIIGAVISDNILRGFLVYKTFRCVWPFRLLFLCISCLVAVLISYCGLPRAVDCGSQRNCSH
jgi:CHASE2 domain-containing sensor protein